MRELYSVCLFVAMADIIVVKSCINRLSMLISMYALCGFRRKCFIKKFGDICRPPSSYLLLDQFTINGQKRQ